LLDLEGAANALTDQMQMGSEQQWFGAVPVRRAVVRTGGRWLALVNVGYKVRLNTGAEAQAVLEAAQPADDAA
jgi:hypothetical protein